MPKCAKSLCRKNVKSFYDNLQSLYDIHLYPPTCVWNCNESGLQASHNGDAYVLSKTRSQSVHQVVLDEQEWLTILTYINAANDSIPNIYIFWWLTILEELHSTLQTRCHDGNVKKSMDDSILVFCMD